MPSIKGELLDKPHRAVRGGTRGPVDRAGSSAWLRVVLKDGGYWNCYIITVSECMPEKNGPFPPLELKKSLAQIWNIHLLSV